MSSNYEMMPYDPSREPDFWSEMPGGPAPAATRRGMQPVTPLERIRRLLRGRLPLALALAVTGGLIGASMGWASQQQYFEGVGFVRIEPFTPTDGGRNEALPGNYRQFMLTEQKEIEGLRIATEAMKEDVWQNAGLGNWQPSAFAGSVTARHSPDTYYIYIHFRDADPLVAETGAAATVQAYEKFFLARRAGLHAQTIESLQRRVDQLNEDVVNLTHQISEEAKVYGGLENLAPYRAQLEAEDLAKRKELLELERNLQLALETRDHVLNANNMLSVEELALGDPEVAARLFEITGLRKRRDELITLGRGPSHPTVKALSDLIAKAETDLEPVTEQARLSYYGQIPNPAGTGGSIALTSLYIGSLELRRKALLADLARLDDIMKRVVSDDRRFRQYDNLIKAKTDEKLATEDRIVDRKRNSEFQQQLANIEANIPPAGSARVAHDRRRAMALVGGVFGFGVPLGVILLIGLLDRRFRYSEDAAEAGERATLLGILPNLPDRLSDPNQASIAAHCVHQIRTMLQINHGSHESRAFAVTSANRGDGKTSLALALGLSYAASGARTLLIDTDLQYGGLSARLGVNSDEGTMDALSRGELLHFVCETDVADLAILPIGRAGANHAGAFSPAAVKHLLDLAKRHFDVIICDTGPILGSIEATPVAAAVDGVVLAVSRGQSRPMVTKALKHLESVGATVAGLVFNRAQASDFERSVSGMNLRNGASPARSRALPNGTPVGHNN